jgi:hypothetical protein
MALESDGDAVGDEWLEVEEDAVLLSLLLTELAGFEDLLDSGEEAVGVGEHDGVELLALGLVDGTALEGFEVEADAGDRRFELVGDGVEEGVLPLVAAHLTDEKDGVEDDSGDQDGKQDDAENEERQVALVMHDPSDVKEDGEAGEQHAERDEDCDGSAATIDVHALRSLTAKVYEARDSRARVIVAREMRCG